ncbi:PilZ domain-containing protein [Alteromonas sp. A079]|uniref:PilZ domain-containing protein n=1 Tax=Alteromonas sp. A079 TaxID=3410268 RepID=UPI003BA325D2
MLGYDDKRNFFRMMVNSPCQLEVTDDESSRTMQAMCKDISATGMSLEVDEPSIEIGTQVSVAIESSSSQIPSLAALATVVRCEPDTDSSCVVGVEITEMK